MNLISIIIPCYNQAQFLPETLQSVLDQTYSNWECIIVNDGSPDNSEEIALEWCKKDSRFRYHKKENGGISSARNAGLILAKGDYIQFLDSDDLLEKDKLMHQSSFFHLTIDIIVSGYRHFESSEGKSKLRIIGRHGSIPETVITMYDNTDLINLFNRRNPFVICATLYKKQVFDIVGNFDEQLHSYEDWDFHLRCSLKNIIFHHSGYTNCSKVLIRLHNNSLTRNSSKMKENYVKFREKHNNNAEYIAYFASPKEDEISLFHKIKLIARLLLPPVFYYLKDKIRELIKTKK